MAFFFSFVLMCFFTVSCYAEGFAKTNSGSFFWTDSFFRTVILVAVICVAIVISVTAMVLLSKSDRRKKYRRMEEESNADEFEEEDEVQDMQPEETEQVSETTVPSEKQTEPSYLTVSALDLNENGNVREPDSITPVCVGGVTPVKLEAVTPVKPLQVRDLVTSKREQVTVSQSDTNEDLKCGLKAAAAIAAVLLIGRMIKKIGK